MNAITRTKDFGNFKEVENVCAPMYGNHSKRNPRVRTSTKTVKKHNDRLATERCEDKIKANFNVGDWFVTLTYDSNASKTVDDVTVKKDMRNFIFRLGRKCDKMGVPLKYCVSTEQKVKNKRYQHHIILPSDITYEVLKAVWKKGSIFTERLRADKHGRLDVRCYAENFVGLNDKKGKKDPNRKRYTFSHNCVAPKITYETYETNT